MDRMKTFFLYALAVLAFFIFSNVMINIALKTSYNSIKCYITPDSNIEINLTEGKATSVNGYVGGTVKNINEDSLNKYIKINFYSARDVLLGTKYVELSELKKDETRDFRMGFKFNNVDYCSIEFVAELSDTATQDEFKSDNMSAVAIIFALIMLSYI